MKDLVELFAACAGQEDTGEINFPTDFEPIDIVLTVVPTEVNLNRGVVLFHVLISDKLEGGEWPGQLLHTEYDVNIGLPIEAIQLAPKAEEDGVT